jgi:hypothetical protein
VVDKFYAAQDGSTSFAVPGRTPEEDRCLFSGVLMEGLWGTNTAAFSKIVKNKITSSSLRTFLEAEVPRRAATYRRELKPIAIPTFPEDDNIYFGDDPVPVPPVFPAWPQPADVMRMGPTRAPSDQDIASIATPELEWRPRGPLFSPNPSAPAADVGEERARGITLPRARNSVARGDRLASAIRNQVVPLSFETGSGFVVDGARVRSIWTERHSVAGVTGDQRSWHVGMLNASGAAPFALSRPVMTLLELDSDTFAAAVALPGFIGSLLCNTRGVAALTYRPLGSSHSEVEATARAIALLEDRALEVDAVTDLAVELRRFKHVDPVLGVLSAYLYESVGDVDSIRRMAFHYVYSGQPIPYDIALLAQLQGYEHDETLVIRVPAVAQRAPRTAEEAKAEWAYSATQAVEGTVAGRVPWMRQGWPLLDDPIDSGSILVPLALLSLTEHVTSGRFTTLNREGGRRLIMQLGLVGH